MLIALTRGLSTSIENCELTFLKRESIDLEKAVEQHQGFKNRLRQMGLDVISLPVISELPDAIFVEDTAVVVDEVAVVNLMGAVQRIPEVKSVAAVLSTFRPLKFIKAPGTLEGGDVVRVGRTFYAGVSGRTNREGVEQLRAILEPYDYLVRPVEVKGCLHLSTGCSYLGNQTMLVNSRWIDATPFERFNLIEVPASEPWAANTIYRGGMVLLPASCTKTRTLLEERGFKVCTTDISELQKAEAGLSCMCLIFNNTNGHHARE